ncbi:hypothetical protein GYMLUDRAFT_59265 [Collybiopsis luxurians FD-317 M1]|uniref:ER membrane protein complex subunit 1 n=1 Tax=Collybiopsis luxurians FD-317 M1 TaxID=944289 RepID=A0A0D0BYI9_9AGAR|nr:hypothetical protein GYMLUDRAFT_59265 [Collybiopsis luxurians FD-317 M1]
MSRASTLTRGGVSYFPFTLGCFPVSHALACIFFSIYRFHILLTSSLGTFIAFGNTTRDLYTLTNGRTVTYISSDVNYLNGGDIVWTWTSEDHSSQILYSTVYATGEVVYVVGLASSFATYTLHVISLSATTGQVLASTSIPSCISSGLDDFILLSDSIIWLENSAFKSTTGWTPIQLKTPINQGARETPYDAYPTWTLSLPEGQDIQSIITAFRDPVASIGKVLVSEPHIVLVLTAPHSSSSSALHANDHVPAHCGLYLVDNVKGSVVYQTILPTERGGSCNVKASFVENWLVYHYYDGESQGPDQTKGYRMVTMELHEGKQVDEKTKSSELSSFSDKMMDITAYEQSFVYPHAISGYRSHIYQVWNYKQGSLTRPFLFPFEVANVNGKIQLFSRRLLNPRRPVGRKPSSEEQEEFLVQYDPVLLDDPRRVLSHDYDVSNTRSIITSPALLESTSLVFAYGLDLFLTRVAPSNTFDVLSENFNKVQLVLTVTGLAAAIFVTRPMVKRKKLREKWYN